MISTRFIGVEVTLPLREGSKERNRESFSVFSEEGIPASSEGVSKPNRAGTPVIDEKKLDGVRFYAVPLREEQYREDDRREEQGSTFPGEPGDIFAHLAASSNYPFCNDSSSLYASVIRAEISVAARCF